MLKWDGQKDSEKLKWDKYWKEEKGNLSLKKKLLIFIRNKIFAPECAKYISREFKTGLIIEAGSGSGCILTKNQKRNDLKIIAIDLSLGALEFCENNPSIDYCIQGDIFRLPFKDNSIDGIWNAGVMEHFQKEDLKFLLAEFKRVLKENGKILLFWPSCKLPISWMVNIIVDLGGLKLPQTIWDPTKKDLEILLKNIGFKNIKIKTSYTLDHYIVVAQK